MKEQAMKQYSMPVIGAVPGWTFNVLSNDHLRKVCNWHGKSKACRYVAAVAEDRTKMICAKLTNLKEEIDRSVEAGRVPCGDCCDGVSACNIDASPDGTVTINLDNYPEIDIETEEGREKIVDLTMHLADTHGTPIMFIMCKAGEKVGEAYITTPFKDVLQ
jgi:hypothetical protein